MVHLQLNPKTKVIVKVYVFVCVCTPSFSDDCIKCVKAFKTVKEAQKFAYNKIDVLCYNDFDEWAIDNDDLENALSAQLSCVDGRCIFMTIEEQEI